MSEEFNDQDMKKLFDSVGLKVKQQDKDLLNGFEDKVLNLAKEKGPGLGIPVPEPALVFALIGLLVLGVAASGLWYMSKQKIELPQEEMMPIGNAKQVFGEAEKVKKPEPKQAPKPTPHLESMQLVEIRSTQRESAKGGQAGFNVPGPTEAEQYFNAERLDQMAADLFILEVLGEDGGLMDDFTRLQTDLDFAMQSPVTA